MVAWCLPTNGMQGTHADSHASSGKNNPVRDVRAQVMFELW
jgi:hypothetical protein